MTNVKMPEPIGYFECDPETLEPIWGEECICQDNIYDQDETGTIGRPIIFTDQAQAYADERVRRANQWVSVNDRLPNDGDSVMFVADCRHPSWEHLHGKVLGGTFREGITGGFGVPGLSMSATHWMPLPPPPKQSTPA